jgi:hypothetical protein
MLRPSEAVAESLCRTLRKEKRCINETRMVRGTSVNYIPGMFFTFGRWSAQVQTDAVGGLARTVGRTAIESKLPISLILEGDTQRPLLGGRRLRQKVE